MIANTTKQKIVELGRGFIQFGGYHSFNYKQIATQLNIKNAAIHHYFPAKEDLGLAVIDKDRQDFMQMNMRVENETPIEQVDAFLWNYNAYFNDNNKMCVIGTYSSVYNEIPEKIQNGAKNYLDFVIDWLSNVFESGRKSGHFKFEVPSERLADFWIAALTGSLQIGRIRGSEYFTRLLEDLKKTLNPQYVF